MSKILSAEIIEVLISWEVEAMEVSGEPRTPAKRERLLILSGKFSAVATMADHDLYHPDHNAQILEISMRARDISRDIAKNYWER